MATVGADGRGAEVRALPRDLSDDGRVLSTEAGAEGARWGRPIAFGAGIGVILTSGPLPIAGLFRLGRGARVVELSLGRRDVGPAALVPWAGAGFAAWTVRESPAPIVAVRRLGETLSPEGPASCLRGFDGSGLAGLLASAAGPTAGWSARDPSGPWRIAAGEAGGRLRWIAGERIETLEPTGRLDPSAVTTDGSLRLPGRRSIALSELAGPVRPIVAAASRGGQVIVAYAAVVDGRRRVRVLRVDRRGQATTPRTLSGGARVEADVAAEWPASGPIVRWREEQSTQVVVREEAVGP
jgi:hypothetical protein